MVTSITNTHSPTVASVLLSFTPVHSNLLLCPSCCRSRLVYCSEELIYISLGMKNIVNIQVHINKTSLRVFAQRCTTASHLRSLLEVAMPESSMASIMVRYHLDHVSPPDRKHQQRGDRGCTDLLIFVSSIFCSR